MNIYDHLYKKVCADKKAMNIKHVVNIHEYIHTITLKERQYFGDYGLLNRSKKRTATIIASEECHFAIIDKSSYEEYLSQ